MEMLANKMFRTIKNSIPNKLLNNEWHLPFISGDNLYLSTAEIDSFYNTILVSAARCARVSYQKHGMETKWEDDLKIGQSLLNAKPPHWSPFEHQAVAKIDYDIQYANFIGWQQARHHPILKA